MRAFCGHADTARGCWVPALRRRVEAAGGGSLLGRMRHPLAGTHKRRLLAPLETSLGPSGDPPPCPLKYGAPGEKIKWHKLAQGLLLSLPPRSKINFMFKLGDRAQI